MQNKLKIRYAVPLKNQEEALRHIELDTQSPPSSINFVNSQFCHIQNTSTTFRNLYLIPVLIGLCLVAVWHTSQFIGDWKKTEASAIQYIERSKRIHGENYFELTNEKLALERYERINPNGTMPFNHFIEYYYHTTENVGGKQRLQRDMIFGTLYLIGIPGFLFWVATYRRQAPLILDRERQLLYHWYKGNVFVQRFNKLRIDEQTQYLIIQLRGIRKNGELGWASVKIQPSGNPLFNTPSSYKPLLAFITQYMEKGLPQVLPNNKEWKSTKPFYLLDDKKPENFEEQLASLLDQIDNNDNEIPRDKNGIPIKH